MLKRHMSVQQNNLNHYRFSATSPMSDTASMLGTPRTQQPTLNSTLDRLRIERLQACGESELRQNMHYIGDYTSNSLNNDKLWHITITNLYFFSLSV